MTAATLRRGLRVAGREVRAIVSGRLVVDPPGSVFMCPGSGSEVLAVRLVHAGRYGCLTCGHHVEVTAGPHGLVLIGHDHQGRRLP